MYQNASKCMQNELCKCFVHEIIKKVVVITFTRAKINEIHLPLCGGTPCRREWTAKILHDLDLKPQLNI